MSEPNRLERFAERYASGEVPWDDVLPPPEVMAQADDLEPGRALDLGCGYGRTSIYLAQHGWRVDGVDFVPQAIDGARARAADAGVSERINFHVHSVSELDFLDGPYDLAVDVGCLHALDEEEQRGYARGVRNLLRPGGRYLLFARLRQPTADDEEGPRGIPEETIYALFAADFRLERVEHGETEAVDRPAWASGWFWFVHAA